MIFQKIISGLYKQACVFCPVSSASPLECHKKLATQTSSNSKSRQPKPSLYRASKISDYRFRRVIEQFAQDASATDAARATGLSINSVHSIYRKLRIFFFECGLFRDFYDGHDPETFDSGAANFERELLAFHLERYGDKHGFSSPSTEPHYHFAESCWRFDFHMMARERPTETIQPMMLSHLMEIIRLCGPVGGKPRNLEAGLQAIMRQTDQRILWLQRNAPGFSSAELRNSLRAITNQ